MTALYLFLGIAGLWLASEIAIGGALQIAERYKISRAFVGLTILAIGTDVPELFVILTAALNRLAGIETSDLVIGETVGTSFGQVGLILGLAGLFGVLTIKKRKLQRDALMLVGSAVLLLLLALDGELSQADGAMMIVVYVIYFASLLREEKIRDKVRIRPQGSIVRQLLYVVGGLVLVGFSADITVTQALALSENWGLSQSVVGALIIGLGTSLPEFATSATAVKMGHGRMAVGNLIGSTTFDILFALGVGTMVSGFLVSPELLRVDLLMLVLLTVLVSVLFYTRLRLGRKEAVLLIVIYLIYAVGKLGGTIHF